MIQQLRSPRRRLAVSLISGVLALPFRMGAFYVMLFTAPRKHAHGLHILDFTSDRGGISVFSKVEAALDLIGHTDALLSARIAKSIKRIILMPLANPALYKAAASACFLDTSYAAQRPIAALALAIVHEGTHARLSKAGIHYGPRSRTRIERACVRAEVSFAEKLVSEPELLADAKKRLADPDPEDPMRFTRRVAQLRRQSLPQWGIRLYERMFGPRDLSRRKAEAAPPVEE